MLGSTQKGTDMSTLAGNKRKRGIQVKDGTVEIVKLDIGENFEHILENHGICKQINSTIFLTLLQFDNMMNISRRLDSIFLAAYWI